MGRVRLELTTLGLKVRLNKLGRAAGKRNALQVGRIVAATS
jgi:hypothetical protein